MKRKLIVIAVTTLLTISLLGLFACNSNGRVYCPIDGRYPCICEPYTPNGNNGNGSTNGVVDSVAAFNRPSSAVQNGVYFMTRENFESFVRFEALVEGRNEIWVNSTLNNDDAFEEFRTDFSAIIHGNFIINNAFFTTYADVDEAVVFSRTGNFYNILQTSYWFDNFDLTFSGNILVIRVSGDWSNNPVYLQLERHSTLNAVDSIATQAFPQPSLSFLIYTTEDAEWLRNLNGIAMRNWTQYLHWYTRIPRWNLLPPVGNRAYIRQPSSQEFVPISMPSRAMTTEWGNAGFWGSLGLAPNHVDYLGFEVGINQLRIVHVGGFGILHN